MVLVFEAALCLSQESSENECVGRRKPQPVEMGMEDSGLVLILFVLVFFSLP